MKSATEKILQERNSVYLVRIENFSGTYVYEKQMQREELFTLNNFLRENCVVKVLHYPSRYPMRDLEERLNQVRGKL